ncbi:MAG: hypothetical protein WA056_00345 [Gallionella sp.]
MRHFGFVKADTLVSIINWVGLLLICLYLICMHIAPWISGRGDWGYVQNIWERWQSLNVGILAFISSLVALNISRFNEKKQRERNFVAARAFLPEALSELTGYFKSSASVLKEAWHRTKEGTVRDGTPLETAMPALPERYKEIFSRCIGLAEPDVGEYLAKILMRLQVHHSRLNELVNSFDGKGDTTFVPGNIRSYLYRLAELQALTSRTFPFARGMEELNCRALVWDDYSNAFGNLDVWVDQFDDLAEFTQRAIDRGSEN